MRGALSGNEFSHGFRIDPVARVAVRLAAASLLAAGIYGSFAAPAGIAGGKTKDDVGFQTAAPHAILIEAETGTVLFEKAADTLVAPASLAKLMTRRRCSTRSRKATSSSTRNSSSASTPGARAGRRPAARPCSRRSHSRVKVSDLLQGAIIQSANDGCIALAEGIAGNEDELRAPDERPRARTRADPIELHQFDRTAGSGQRVTVARTCQARAPHHHDLSGILQVVRRDANSPGTRSASRTAIRCSP